MKGFIRKYWQLGVGLLLAVCLIVFLGRVSLVNRNVSESAKQKSYRLTVALVNEDRGGNFHNMNYNFGNNFVNLITKDTDNNWTVTSRDIAESGLRHKTYEMVLIIPNNFTQRTLQLENRNPQQAQLQYKVNTSKNPAIRSQAQQKVTQLLQLFNQRVINMYFSSIVNNLHTAQTNVGSMVNREGYLNGNLSNNVYKPFQGLGDNFSEITDQSSGIQDNYNDWQDQAKQFNGEVKDAMNQTVSNGQDSLKGLTSFNTSQNKQMLDNKKTSTDYYTQSIETEKELMKTDHQKLIANDKQSTDAYNKQYQAFTDQINTIKSDQVSQLTDLSGTVQDHLQTLLTANNALNPAIKSLRDQYDAGTKVLADEKTQLSSDQENLRTFFTGSKKGDIKDQALIQCHLEGVIKTALGNDADLEKQPVNDKGRAAIEAYMTKNAAAVDANIEQALEWMQFAGGITGEQASAYQHDADLIKKYAADKHINLKNTAAVADIKTVVGNNVGTNAGTGLYFNMPGLSKGDKGCIEFSLPNSVNIDAKTLADLINTTEAGKFKATATKSTEITLEALQNIEADSVDSSIDVESDAINKAKVFTFNTAHFPDSLLGNAAATVDYTVTVSATNTTQSNPVTLPKADGTKVQTTIDDPIRKTGSKLKVTHGEFSITYSNNANSSAIGSMMHQVNDMLYRVSQTGSIIKAYYGASGGDDGLSNESYATLAQQAPASSLYHQLDNGSLIDEISSLVASQLSAQFQTQAVSVDQQIETEKQQLQDQIDNTGYSEQQAVTLNQIKEQNANIQAQGQDLMKWYQSALKATNAVKVPAIDPLVLDEDQTPLEPAEQPELAEDKTSGPDLIKSYQEQLADSQSAISKTMADTAKIKSMTPAFEHLKTSTARLSSTSKAIVSNASGLAQTWGTTIAKNGDFSKNFNGVLANTKKGNADNQGVYNYLSDPVKAKNGGEISTNTSILPYYLVLVMIFATLFTAYILSTLEKSRSIRLIDRFVNVDNVLWKNLPWTIMTVVVGIVEGTLIGYIAEPLLQTNQIAMSIWFLTTILVEVIALSLSTYLLRQTKTAGMAVLIAISAMYLFFTPSLGVKLMSGSWTQFFMSLSPLQYVEKIYTKLTTGVSLSTGVYIWLAVLAVAATAMNLIVYRSRETHGGVRDEKAATTSD
ncbi:type VII secretion protein EsaA [Furfurilactobacillus rossiae]|nr:type VII secretion protein EsaA [Furfurilactobacillus rossiae]